ncbi:multi-sensor signal transduction histidine kinase [Solidesulfovibrio fructosivorans JJ]]|uniref:histidine kinase n=1 Tax=Solidesulfovibrio fructosivorans JJ] TaxID=596151 RepID=E1JTL3_SOLFR|nr:PAS domain S-box protein [Solidesulfovibrio fructosivorans]EFL52473.1 multi-sensor signal transduction histidine kinase [Solidesulfovibrio fructosivorans JJ]]
MALAVAALCAIAFFDLPLFHVLSEMTCIIAGVAAFLVIWNARAFVEHAFFLVIGLAFLIAAGFDTAYLLLTAGLTRLPLPPGLAGAVWTGSHIAFALSLCVGAWMLGRTKTAAGYPQALVLGLNLLLMLAFAALATMPGATGPHATLFPDAPLDRLPPSLLFIGAGLGLLRYRDRLATPVVRLLLGATACLALSDAAFAWPGDALWPRVIGHATKVLGYALSCQAIVVTGISRPYDLLFREIGLREQDLNNRLVRLGAQAQAIFELSSLEALESGEFKSFAATLLTRAMSVLGVARSGIWVLSPDRERLLCLLGSGSGQADTGVELSRADYPDYFEAIAHERVIVAENAAASPLTRDLAESFLEERGIASLLDAPFRFSGRLAGVLSLRHVGNPRRFADDEQAFAGSLADTLSLALETSERRRAARELAASEQRLRSLLDAMPDPVCFKDADGRWIVANPAQIEVFGLGGVSWKGQTDASLAASSSGDRQALAAAAVTDAHAWATREVSVFGLSLTGADGNTRHFDVIKAPLFHDDGRPKGLVILSRDITAYRDALSRLRESNEELEAIYNETSDGLIIADAVDQRIVRVNAAACRMFDYKPQQLTALSPWDLHPEDERERSITRFREINAGRLHLMEAIPCSRKAGHVFYADIAAQPITYGGRPAILGFFRDISERRAAGQALAASEERFRKVFNSTYDAIFLHDADGVILDCNDKMLELYGVRREEAFRFSIENDYSAPDNPPGRILDYWREVMSGEERFFEWKARRPHDGSVFYVEVYLRRLKLPERDVILANVRDVTERRRVLAALAARQSEISALNRDLSRRVNEETEKNRQKDILLLNQTRLAAMGEMIGNIAHQWRQPLNALSILLANMRFEYENVCEGDTASLIAAHRQAGEILRKMSSTIDDFRNFFKPDKQREPFLVVTAISDALLLIEASLAQHGVAVRFTARHNPRVLGFHGEFSQVVLNLLSNAKDSILTTRQRGGVIAIRVMARQGQAVIHITDNGGGIPEAIQERVFDPYFTTKTDTDGTGLGLYMSKTIVEDHLNGRLTARNVRDGARLTIRIPLDQPKGAASPAAASTPQAS